MQVAHTGSNHTRVRSVDDPLPTIPAGHRGELAVCEPFLTKYYGAGNGARPVNEPLDTITAKDRFALVEPRGMDIRFRMLQPRELAAAMGFDGYEFAGTKTDQVRQIGNAVAVRTAEALCGAMIDAGKGGVG
jgi:DNA (cytosine-5)-methyltransferase 1